MADALHFSKAAERLFVTQPTMSHRLAELETQIGTPLFDRSGKAVRLTQAGEVFRSYAKRCIDEIDAGCSALAELEGLQRGVLRIGVTQSFIHKLMPPILGEFFGSYPAVRLQVEETTALQIEQGLADGRLDLGIAFAPTVLEDTELEPILEERLMLVTGRDHPLAPRQRMPIAELQGWPLALLTRDFSTRRLIETYFAQVGIDPPVVCETNTITLMLGLVKSCNVVSVVPESAIDDSAQVHVIALEDPVPVRVSALLWSRHNYRTLAANTFAKLVRERFVDKLPVRS